MQFLRFTWPVRFAPQHERYTEKTDRGDRGYERRRQLRNCFSDDHGQAHLGHERCRHAYKDRRGTITRGQHARRIQQLVADNLRDKNRRERSEQNQNHRFNLQRKSPAF